MYHIDYFFQWGTPEDYKEFIYNLNEVDNIKSKKRIDLKNEVNLLIPAAGESKRFKDEGYKNSKIYLDVNGSSILNKVIKKSSSLIKVGGKLILEIGFNQEIKTKKILKANGFYINRIVKDFAGINRCIVSTKL